MLRNKAFYFIKPFIPRKYQLFIRRVLVFYKLEKYSQIWPIDPKASRPPKNWTGWPNGKKFALVLTHDVDSQKGYNSIFKLTEIEEKHGFRSSFNFVVKKYNISEKCINLLKTRGFEIGIHGVYHDGMLYSSKKIFEKRAVIINRYLKSFEANGFRSPSMHHNLDWIHTLDIQYDASTFDTDPFEPQSDGMATIFPFIVKSETFKNYYIELPYTLPQDFTIFILMKKKVLMYGKVN